METILRFSECCHAPVQVVKEYESKFTVLPNVHAYLLECRNCKVQYVYMMKAEKEAGGGGEK